MAVRSKGKIDKPYFIYVYGETGTGKSTFASEAPHVEFLDVENGTSQISGVSRVAGFENYEDFLKELHSTASNPKIESIAIDTIDHLETMMCDHVCKTNNVKNLGDIAFGGGFFKLRQEWESLFKRLEEYRNSKNIILLGHSEVKTSNDPSLASSFDRHQIKLSKQASSLVKDKVDAILFMAYETFVNVDKATKKGKGVGGADRVMYTEYRAHHDGKNRFGLPYKIEMPEGEMWKTFDLEVKASDPESFTSLCSQIEGLLTKVKGGDIREKAQAQYAEAKTENNIKKLVLIKERLLQVTQE